MQPINVSTTDRKTVSTAFHSFIQVTLLLAVRIAFISYPFSVVFRILATTVPAANAFEFKYIHSYQGRLSHARHRRDPGSLTQDPNFMFLIRTGPCIRSTKKTSLPSQRAKQPTRDFRMSNTRKRMTPCSPVDSGEKTKVFSNSIVQRPLVIVIAGPTAVGKSDVAAELCSSSIATDIIRRHRQNISQQNLHLFTDGGQIKTRGHIISADSVQSYRGVNIGANKPSVEEMERTPHHLVDIVDPPKNDEQELNKNSPNKMISSYNAADWMRDAEYVVHNLTMHPKEEKRLDSQNVDDKSDGNSDFFARRDYIDAFLKTCQGDEIAVPSQPILPVVVGGTMMYLQWLTKGRPDAIRPTDQAMKRAADVIMEFRTSSRDLGSNVESIEQCTGDCQEAVDSPLMTGCISEDISDSQRDDIDARSWASASEFVSSLGPVFAGQVEKLCGRDWYRLRRLLEVAYTIVSSKMKQMHEDKSHDYRDDVGNEIDESRILRELTNSEIYTGIRSGSLEDLYDVRCFFLCPNERMLHFHTVDRRCEEMLSRGLLRETATLYIRGSLPEESQVARAIGYRQAIDYLLRKDPKKNDRDAFLSFVDDFATSTRQYAKKQMQWFRRDSNFAFVPIRMECSKEIRVQYATKVIADMCQLSRDEFVSQLDFDIDEASKSIVENVTDQQIELPLSARTKLENERQGKGMKFFISKRELLLQGSTEFENVMAEADYCTNLVQSCW